MINNQLEMNSIHVIFSQSQTESPYEFYQQMLVENPIYWDEKKKKFGQYIHFVNVNLF